MGRLAGPNATRQRLKIRFNGDGFAVIAAGVPYEDFNGTNEGAVNVIYGSAAGLTEIDDQLGHKNSLSMAGTRLDNERFGWTFPE